MDKNLHFRRFFVISVMTDVYVIASRRTVRLCSPILPIGSLSNVEGAVIKQDECRILRLRSAILRTCSAQSCPGSLSNVEGSAISKTAAGRLRYCKPWRRLYFLLVPALHFHQFLFIPFLLKVCGILYRQEFCKHWMHHGEDLRQCDFFIACK